MRFKEIFKSPGLYIAEGFAEGVCFSVSKEGFLNLLIYSSLDDLLPKIMNPVIYEGLLDKDYYQVLNKKDLFR